MGALVTHLADRQSTMSYTTFTNYLIEFLKLTLERKWEVLEACCFFIF